MTTWTADASVDGLGAFDSYTAQVTVTNGRYVFGNRPATPMNTQQATIDVFGASGAADGVTFLRMYVKEESGDAPNLNYLELVELFDTTGTSMGSIYLTDSRKVIYLGTGWTSSSGLATLRRIGTDTWHMVEFYFDNRLAKIIGRMDGSWESNHNTSGTPDTGQRLRSLKFGQKVNGIIPSYTAAVQMDHLYVSDDKDASWAGAHLESGIPAKHAIFFLDGYESGTMHGHDTGASLAATIVTDQVRNGEYAMKFAPGAVLSSYIQKSSGRIPPMPEFGMRFACRFEAFPSAGNSVPIVRLVLNSAKISQLTISDAGVVVGDLDTSDASTVTGPTIGLNQWYAFDVALKWFDGTWTLQWRYRDDVTRVWTDLTTETLTSMSLDWPSIFRIGLVTAGKSCIMRHDDLVLSMSAADFPFEKGAVLVVRPDEAGTHVNPSSFQQTTDDGSTWAAIDGTAFSLIDDNPLTVGATADGCAQYVTGASDYLEFLFTDPDTDQTAAASQLTVFTKSDDTLPQVYAFAYSDGSHDSIKDMDWQGAHTIMSRDNFLMAMGVGNETDLPMAWEESVLRATRMRFGYSTDASLGYLTCHNAMIQSVYDDGFELRKITIAWRVGQQDTTFKTMGD